MRNVRTNGEDRINNWDLRKNGGPTLFVRMMDLQCDLREAVGLSPLEGWKKRGRTPDWVKSTCVRYRQTILKSVLKLKPGERVNWRNYGRCIGLMERSKAFYAHEVPKMLREDGLDKLSNKQQTALDAISGEEEMRAYCLKVLKRPASDPTPTEELVCLLFEELGKILEKHRQVALHHLAEQDVKTCSLFWKGVSEGYLLFLNADGELSGDDRRTEIYGDLLTFQYEVEKMRRKLPAKSRVDLRMELQKLTNFKDRGQGWFNDVCREIKLSMKGQGRPHKCSRPSNAIR